MFRMWLCTASTYHFLCCRWECYTNCLANPNRPSVPLGGLLQASFSQHLALSSCRISAMGFHHAWWPGICLLSSKPCTWRMLSFVSYSQWKSLCSKVNGIGIFNCSLRAEGRLIKKSRPSCLIVPCTGTPSPCTAKGMTAFSICSWRFMQARATHAYWLEAAGVLPNLQGRQKDQPSTHEAR